MSVTTSDRFELLHAATDHVNTVDVPERRLLAIDGLGVPGGIAFQEALDALYATATALATRRHAHEGAAHPPIGHLEGLWWTQDDTPSPQGLPIRFEERQAWHWRLMLEVPLETTEAEARAAIEDARRHRARPGLDRIRLIRFAEGRCVQLLHRGAQEDELPAMRRLEEEARAGGYRLHGRHHEIYLSDPRVTPSDRWRTILRHPVEPA